ncbi:MAG: Imm1 family immunity protein [Myxococcales bacterium]
MYTTLVTWDEGEIAGPSLEEVERLVRGLDGESSTIVVLRGEGTGHLAVGGGPDRFVVYATRDNVEFASLIAPDRPDDRSMEQVVAGGQMGEYERRKVVSRDEALKAALRYASDGSLDSSSRWEEDN